MIAHSLKDWRAAIHNSTLLSLTRRFRGGVCWSSRPPGQHRRQWPSVEPSLAGLPLVREKSGKFKVREKSGNFEISPGILEICEKSGKLH